MIVKASEEQIRALSQHQEGGVWPFGESRGTTNLFQKRPEHSNQYGEVREVTANDYRQLEDLDVTVSFANITKVGLLISPFPTFISMYTLAYAYQWVKLDNIKPDML